MATIQASPHPLVYKVRDPAAAGLSGPAAAPRGGIGIRIYARAMEGMQKEALVWYAPAGTVWRLVSDEGPYLNGTDLAPFPLAFFTTGMVSSYVAEIVALARQRGIALGSVRVTIDNQYGMEGSAFHGTMTGSAMPVELSLEHEGDLAPGLALELASQAIGASPARALAADKLANVFSLFNGGRRLDVTKVAAHPKALGLGDEALFERAQPAVADSFAPEIIRKLEDAKAVVGAEGGAGSSLKSEQKRTLHVRGVCTLREDGVKRIKVQLFKPIGSTFEFLSDDPPVLGGGDRAPDGLSYLSAGIAFCYLTQIGRYATIRKLRLDEYRLIQDTGFSLPGASGQTGKAGEAAPVETHVTLRTGEDDEVANEIVRMGEQTCFLHATCRSNVQTRIRVGRLSGAQASGS